MRYVNYIGYAAIPIAYLVHFFIGHGKSWEPIATFIFASLGILPLAHLMGESTEHLAEHTGPTIGGLLNATFGNAAEMIIAVIGIAKGLNDVVRASITGSILGNLLLVGGLAMVVGGWRRERQRFNPQAAEANAGLLVLGVSALLFPAIFHITYQYNDPKLIQHEHGVSIATSVILLAVYALGLLFTLRTHAHIFSPKPSAATETTAAASGATGPDQGVGSKTLDYAAPAGHGGGHGGHGATWSVKRSVITLLAASAGVGLVAELLVESAEKVGHSLGWNPIFIGVIVLAIIGNAAEHSTAIFLAAKDDMDTAMTITHQSSLQIALFVTPFLVFLSIIMTALGIGKSSHLDLIFSPMEVVAVLITVGIIVVLGINGETNWFEGVLLLAVYCILGIVFFYIPEATGAGYHGSGATTLPAGVPAALPAGGGQP